MRKDRLKMGDSMLTVCLITYNHKDYIKQAIDSVLMQKVNFAWELIIADDCSTDGTTEILLDYKKRHPEFIQLILQKKNIGPAKNWLELIRAPKSKYVAYFEGDDYWTDEYKLQKQVDFLEDNSNFTGCFHNVIFENEINRGIKAKPWREYDKNIFESKDTFSRKALFHTSSFVFKRIALETPEWFNKVASGDMALFSIIASKGNLKMLPGNMSVYRKNERSITTNEKIRSYHKNRIFLWKCINDYYDNRFSKELNTLIEYHKLELKQVKINFVKKILIKAKTIFGHG